MKEMRNILLVAVGILVTFSVAGQDVQKEPINITGLTLDAESLDPLPFTSILVGDGKRGTISDNTGYFSFLAYPGDTITFRSVSYKNSKFVIPKMLAGETYSLIQLMVKDTVLLEEVVVYPLPGIQDFASTMLQHELTPNEANQVKRFKDELNEVLEMEYERNKYEYDQWRYAKLYNMTGLVPPNNFLNPMTWSNFIRDWKEVSKDRR